MPDETQTPPSAGDCLACRGGGQVASNLGGESRLVPCPWCEGSGVRLAGHDAQARWRGEPAAGAVEHAGAGVGQGAGPGEQAA